MAPTPELGVQGHADAMRFTGALSPWANGRDVPQLRRGRRSTRVPPTATAWRQLSGIRSAVDPDNLFAANHPIPRLHEAG